MDASDYHENVSSHKVYYSSSMALKHIIMMNDFFTSRELQYQPSGYLSNPFIDWTCDHAAETISADWVSAAWFIFDNTQCRLWGSEQVDLIVWILKLTLLYLINYPWPWPWPWDNKLLPTVSRRLFNVFRAPTTVGIQCERLAIKCCLTYWAEPLTPRDGVRRNPRWYHNQLTSYRPA
jgi:hypothetical protein